MSRSSRRGLLALVVALALGATGCRDTAKVDVDRATSSVGFLAETVDRDVAEVRTGLPAGAAVVAAIWKSQPELAADPGALRGALLDARAKVQDLRIAKATFFALSDPGFVVLRNDQEQDRMAGRPLLGAFPALTTARTSYVEALGSLPEASGVREGRPDAQWVAGSPVSVDGSVRGIYLAGWSLSAYAYRLEFALRGKLRSELLERPTDNEPLVYVLLITGSGVYGAPVSPEVSREEVARRGVLGRLTGDAVAAEHFEISGRGFGLAARRVPALGPDVAVAVLHSET
ncbi:MAG: hypothetical protein FJ104_14215 [Deltaproteobacteria bacterium]|nr:hypothetical protein [Deltaproteobacteria bacterium]